MVNYVEDLWVSISNEDSARISGGAEVAIDVGAEAQGEQFASTYTNARTFVFTVPQITVPTGNSSTSTIFGGKTIAIGFGFAQGIAID